MAITLNGTTISANKLNNVDVERESLNGTTVYEVVQNATKWTYYGTSGGAIDTYTYSYSGGACRTTSAVLADLTAAKPPAGYAVGAIMRVNHSTYYFQGGDIVPVLCTTLYFVAQ